ncbi:MAG: DNA methyltransferase [candidate division WOR-3 bacterium]|nr:DNA methyltransferase [Thermoproteota archaeon]
MHRDVILHGDVYACLDYLDDNSIAVAITSPPYWKQRDYKFEGQIGQEKTPEEYIGRLVKVFNKLRQKLRSDGIFFLNVGDKYLNQYGKSHLLQIPYRLAYHIVKDGWYLEDIIIWYKPNHMPSSVKDRFSNTYEPVFVLAKSRNNIYQKNKHPRVVEIPLQQTPWKHTAVYPENLVMEMLRRVELKDGDLILDPFAGTGTTAVVVNKIRNNIYAKRIYSVMIEKGDEFVNIIKERAKIKEVIRVEDIHYEYQPVVETGLPEDVKPNPILKDKHGEVYIAQNQREFLSALKGITLEEFKKFHREDALYFFGVKEWDLSSLYYAHTIYQYGYVLRNMLIVSNGSSWYPIFMFARDSTKVAYKFYLDRVRIKPKTKEKREWQEEEFIGMKVIDNSKKETTEGYIVKVLEKYDDGFPKVVIIQWNGKASIEFVVHPKIEEFLMEGVKFSCPKCNSELTEPYNPIGDNFCPSCGQKLWVSLDTVPLVREPQEVIEVFRKLENNEYSASKILDVKEFKIRKIPSRSKFSSFERINWGASPGARKVMLGEYFTKMRLYRIDQPVVAQYLTLLRKAKNLSIQDIINKLPKEYYHTVGHWFRKDFGGSIPVPQDIELIEAIFDVQDRLLRILKRTALKFQTVKTSIKGKNPRDYIKSKNDEDIIKFLRMLYIPSNEYITLVAQLSNRREILKNCRIKYMNGYNAQ